MGFFGMLIRNVYSRAECLHHYVGISSLVHSTFECDHDGILCFLRALIIRIITAVDGTEFTLVSANAVLGP